MENYSVLMSVYHKEKPSNAEACFKSLLSQTVPAEEWVIVEDGPLTPELYEMLDKYSLEYPNLITRVPLKENIGLGLALREGVLHCRNELIGRMDTDDICVPERFERQLEMFKENPDLDICGSHIREFENTPDVFSAERRVPLTHTEIADYQKRRDGVNHVTVMFKKSSVLKAGNYQHALLMEDSLLWINMLINGAQFANIDDYLVLVRTGADMYARRGGFAYFKKYKKGRRQIYNTGYISWFDYFYTLAVQFVVALMPASLRRWIFTKLLRG